MQIPMQTIYYVVFFETCYDSLADAFSKAPEVIAAHQARSKEWHAQGSLLLAGAFRNAPKEPLSTMTICTTREAAEEYAKGDPFLLNAMIRSWSIREWTNIFA
jgi:uncharacterized protein YciI